MNNQCKTTHQIYTGIRREYDATVIENILKHPSIFYNSTDDSCPTPEGVKVITDSINEFYVVDTKEHKNVGIFIVNYLTCSTCVLHVGFLPCARGDVAKLAAIDLIVELSTRFHVATCFIPKEHQAAIKYAKFAGFEETGTIPKGVLRNNELMDLIILSRGLRWVAYHQQQELHP
jgi:hypothetical protein